MLRIIPQNAWYRRPLGEVSPPIVRPPSTEVSITAVAPPTPCSQVRVAASPAECPSCPSNISCSPCMPYACPSFATLDGPTLSWHFEAGGKGTTDCVREATALEKATCEGKSLPVGGADTHWYDQRNVQVAGLLLFAVGLIGAGIAVAYHRDK